MREIISNHEPTTGPEDATGPLGGVVVSESVRVRIDTKEADRLLWEAVEEEKRKYRQLTPGQLKTLRIRTK